MDVTVLASFYRSDCWALILILNHFSGDTCRGFGNIGLFSSQIIGIID